MRLIMHFFLLLALLAGGAGASLRAGDDPVAAAATPGLKDCELLGNADLIVVATVNKVQHLAGMPNWAAGELTLKVQQVVKGKHENLEWVTVRHARTAKPVSAKAPAARSGLDFEVGDRRLFFLVEFLDGYQVLGGEQGVREESEAGKYADMMKDEVALVTMEPLNPAAATMGELVSVTFEITNHATLPVLVYDATLGGYFLAADQQTPEYFMAHDDSIRAKASLGQVSPNGKLRITVQLKAALAARDLPSRGVTIPVRLKIFLKPLSHDRNDGYYLQSAPQDFLVRPGIMSWPAKSSL